MIVKMRHLDLICVAEERKSTLEKLGSLGAVHLEIVNAPVGSAYKAVRGELEAAEKALRLILKIRGKRPASSLELRPHPAEEILKLEEERQSLLVKREQFEREIKIYEPYGDFDPELAKKLNGVGFKLILRENGAYAFLALDDEDNGQYPLPAIRLSAMRNRLRRTNERIAIIEEQIAAADDKVFTAKLPMLANRIEFETAMENLAEHGVVSVISGWIPGVRAEEIRKVAAASGWGVWLREPTADETPPTLVEPPRFFRPMKALFDGLGIAPAYSEADVSVPFMCYFSLFFAMLVGDGAYGAIFLTGTLLLRKKLPRSWFILLTVFSSATVLWGLLSNTWFGAGFPFAKDWPTVQWLADPSYHNMMLLCFTIGVSHLMLARIWNGICKINDSTAVAEFGWAGVLLFMYLVTNSIVGIFSGIPGWAYYVLGISLVAVFGFSVKPSELKTRGAELGMLPLNIMSALGDIISYVRLFAVGLASVKVAENFNSMAIGLVNGDNAIFVNILMSLAMVAILVIGHVLNLAMAGLSILVHAVRLNTLEFSNHKGVSWAGYAFRPFSQQTKQVNCCCPKQGVEK